MWFVDSENFAYYFEYLKYVYFIIYLTLILSKRKATLIKSIKQKNKRQRHVPVAELIESNFEDLQDNEHSVEDLESEQNENKLSVIILSVQDHSNTSAESI